MLEGLLFVCKNAKKSRNILYIITIDIYDIIYYSLRLIGSPEVYLYNINLIARDLNYIKW